MGWSDYSKSPLKKAANVSVVNISVTLHAIGFNAQKGISGKPKAQAF
jgi:hypothetical protein